MQIDLTQEQSDMICHAIDAGRLRRPEDAIQEALALWIERERLRVEILAAVDAAEHSLAHDDMIAISEESMRQLAEDVKRRGRARIAAERKAER